MVRKNYLAICIAFMVVSFGLSAAEPWVLPEIKYPVVTSSMQPAIIELNYDLDYSPVASVAIVGVDEISAKWLQLNNDYLLSIGSVGLVVNAPSAEQVDVLRTYTEMPLFALPVSEYFMRFGGYYPLLVDHSEGRVRQ